MAAINYRKTLQSLYKASAKTPVIVDVPALQFLMVDGQGHPQDQSFQDAASTIYPVAYTLKFMIKAAHPEQDYAVMPLEVKWWLNRQEHGSKRFAWTMMVMQPECITPALYQQAVEQAQAKRELPCLASLRFEQRIEGLCAQILHKGAYEGMNATFERVKTYLQETGYTWEADSHDIYLNDMRKTKPENLKTIIRTSISKHPKEKIYDQN